MRLVRTATAVAVVGLLAGAGVSHAAVKPKPVCNLVTDAPGDAAANPTGGGNDTTFDITSVDVASDKNFVTTVMRLAGLSTGSSSAPEGINWGVDFTVDGSVFTVAAHADPTGALIYDAAVATTAGGSIYDNSEIHGVFDTAKKEIRITVPLSLLAADANFTKSTKFTAIDGVTAHEVALPDKTGLLTSGELFTDAFASVDTTTGGKDYTAQTASCVAVGK